MAQPGIGAMLHMLSGGSEHNPDEFYGKRIKAVRHDKESDPEFVEITFDDGIVIKIMDAAQSCCESRYITCDDDWQTLVGGVLTAIDTKPADDIDGDYGDVHEQVFIDIKTDKGFVTFTTHNEHNGYYGGFGLTIRTE